MVHGERFLQFCTLMARETAPYFAVHVKISWRSEWRGGHVQEEEKKGKYKKKTVW